ncbi:DUF3817 domain-containing protein [Antrihabitans sp. YC2-6]|uniref:DUF3817 domain-containing protein n=1 Tax=Antrihabitans sp. YC2-6 TaxID=2799498 RepID=UPI0018F478A4|nr:DUF3817 domain-containing protein [Antrihabitans sp. YC2-6]MBJ8346595.1 DUF3817 domain-containing protein [Antrihabitans sp. YC2-6]
MGQIFDLSTTAKRFRFVAVLEAFTWLGLLIGMAFKYIPDPGNEIGVKIFGPIHGVVFIAFVAISLLTARVLSWDLRTTALAVVSSIPPFGTLVFEVWAVRTGRLAELSAAEPVLVES